MRELPILFSAPMVRAILEGRKTVTRRTVKPQPSEGFGYVHPTEFDRGVRCWTGFVPTPGMLGGTWTERKAPYQVGDRLWVREAHALEHDVEGGEPPHADGRPVLRRPDDDVDGLLPAWTQPHYRATDPAPDLCCESPRCAQCRDHDMGPHWRPAIHMPRWASRITLEVTAVRVERLQDISEEQAHAEGLLRDSDGWRGALDLPWFASPVAAFRSLWESINGAGSWADKWTFAAWMPADGHFRRPAPFVPRRLGHRARQLRQGSLFPPRRRVGCRLGRVRHAGLSAAAIWDRNLRNLPAMPEEAWRAAGSADVPRNVEGGAAWRLK